MSTSSKVAAAVRMAAPVATLRQPVPARPRTGASRAMVGPR
ncbi:MAG: hypothetical protein ACK52I_28510 [Pseudomonadota bacterium]